MDTGTTFVSATRFGVEVRNTSIKVVEFSVTRVG